MEAEGFAAVAPIRVEDRRIRLAGIEQREDIGHAPVAMQRQIGEPADGQEGQGGVHFGNLKRSACAGKAGDTKMAKQPGAGVLAADLGWKFYFSLLLPR